MLRDGLTQNRLKMIAAIAMLIDHIGAELFPQITVLRVIGRLAFPLFAYFIYEGFQYTHSKRNYFFRILSLGLLCMIVYYLYSGELYGNVLITFSLSILVMFGISLFRQRMGGTIKDKISGFLLFFGSVFCAWLLCTQITVDYGFLGVLLPGMAELARSLNQKRKEQIALVVFSVGLFLLSRQMGGVQYFSLLVIPLLIAYNGKRGVLNLKSFFYWFYPVHLAAIGVVSQYVCV